MPTASYFGRVSIGLLFYFRIRFPSLNPSESVLDQPALESHGTFYVRKSGPQQDWKDGPGYNFCAYPIIGDLRR